MSKGVSRILPVKSDHLTAANQAVVYRIVEAFTGFSFLILVGTELLNYTSSMSQFNLFVGCVLAIINRVAHGAAHTSELQALKNITQDS